VKNDKYTKILKEYAIITVGIFLIAVGTFFFEFPNSISTGGITGLAIVTNQAFPIISTATYVTVFNSILLILGFIILGKDFGIKTIYGSVLLTLFLQVFDLIPYPHFIKLPLTNEPVLELIFAIFFASVGLGIIFFYGASSGGTDIIAMIIRKFTRLDSGKALLVADSILVLLTFYNFDTKSVSIITGMLSLTAFISKSFVINYVIEGMNRSKYFLVVTTHREEIEKYILYTLERGATTWECEGAYTHNKSFAIASVMNSLEAYKLRKFIKEVDPVAFTIVLSTSDIIGDGFRQI